MAKASLHPIWLLGGLLPFIGGRAGHFGQWWGEAHTIFEFWAAALYIGIPGLIFLAASPFNLRRQAGESWRLGRAPGGCRRSRCSPSWLSDW